MTSFSSKKIDAKINLRILNYMSARQHKMIYRSICSKCSSHYLISGDILLNSLPEIVANGSGLQKIEST